MDNQYDERLKVIKYVYPELYEAYKIVELTLRLNDREIEFKTVYHNYPAIFFIPKREGGGFSSDISIYFSPSCSLVLNPTDKEVFISTEDDTGEDYPEKLKVEELKKWLPLIVYRNRLHEERLE